MGPLIPYGIISPEWTMVLIFFIGLGFGAILEQAGFSSSRKLVGTFFGYDFVVLKVFFTAAIVAIVGVVFMDFFGVLDTSVIFVHSNFLTATLVGGAIMGVGFLFGGFCPGTSVAALSIGKIDAMVFVAGLFLGIFVYGEFFSVFEGLFSGRYFDRETIFSLVGLSKGAFVFWLIVAALLAFAVAGYLESTVPEDRWQLNSVNYKGYGLEVILLLVVAFMILLLPKPINSYDEMDDDALFKQAVSKEHYVNTDELAFKMVNEVDDIQIVDVRDAESYSRFHLPGSINIQYQEVITPGWKNTLDKEFEKTIFVSNGGILADKAWLLSTRLGYHNVYVLHGGLNQFVDDIFHSPKPDKDAIHQEIHDQYRFRKRVANLFQKGDEIFTSDNQPTQRKPVTKQTVSVSGGC
ncbi:MAG: rhodanese-like domain-containing protein [Salinivirgaceae bacterium]|jgi:rhodanese-related sulfurtransferase/uncharacterized membrane protein YedE/YeeE|nr:rhodanese-like domain-containing protein [Salinivirgaceae bacterium]